MKDSFIFHFENIEDIEDLTLEEQGMIFHAMIEYAQSGKEPEFEDRALRAAWRPIRRRIKADGERYEAVCKRNQENIQKRWERQKGDEASLSDTTVYEDIPSDTTVYQNIPNDTTVYEAVPNDTTAIPKNTKNTDTDTDTDTEMDTDTDTERDKTRARGADPIPYAQIIEYLNRKTGASYKDTAKETRRCIRARWNDGYRLDDFKAVINKKCDDWLRDDKMAAMLRPITLFGSKFENYLHQPRAKPKGQFFNYQQRDDDLDELERKLQQQFFELMEAEYGGEEDEEHRAVGEV